MYKLVFSDKGTSKNIPPAVRLAKTLKAQYDEGSKQYSIESKEFSPNFRKLLDLTMNMRNTEFEYDGQIVEDIELFSTISTCPKKRSCKGLCSIAGNYKEIFESIGLLPRPSFSMPDEFMFESLNNPELIVFYKKNKLGIDKGVLRTQYMNDTLLPKALCPKYSMDNFDEKYKTLSETIEVELDIYNEPEDEPDYGEIETAKNVSSNHMVISLSDDTIDKLAAAMARHLNK